jgi:hypothetical protein
LSLQQHFRYSLIATVDATRGMVSGMLFPTISSGGGYGGGHITPVALTVWIGDSAERMGATTHFALVQGGVGWAGATVKERYAMKVATNPPLYWKVCLINGAVFIGAATLLVVSPATVSHRVTGPELAVLATGLVVILATNAALLHSTLAPLDRLIGLLDRFQPDAVGRRLPSFDRGVAAMLAASFNAPEAVGGGAGHQERTRTGGPRGRAAAHCPGVA